MATNGNAPVGVCGNGSCCVQGQCSGHCGMRMGKMVVMMVVGVAAIGWFTTSAMLNWAQKKQVGVLPLERHTLTVSADDKVVAVPDLAAISIGISTDGDKISDVQNQNTQKFNDLLKSLKALGIAEADIKTTSYNINPKYEWMNNTNKFMGYTVSQNVEVKIRDLSKAGDALQVAGGSGANQVGGLDFRVDNPDKYQDDARALAVAKAKAKADMMAKQAGFTLGKIVNFSESGYSPTPYPMYYAKAMMDSAAAAPAPTIQPGTTDITSSVSLTYEIE